MNYVVIESICPLRPSKIQTVEHVYHVILSWDLLEVWWQHQQFIIADTELRQFVL